MSLHASKQAKTALQMRAALLQLRPTIPGLSPAPVHAAGLSGRTTERTLSLLRRRPSATRLSMACQFENAAVKAATLGH